jgi:carboxypeptidase C (cathepsin A)
MHMRTFASALLCALFTITSVAQAADAPKPAAPPEHAAVGDAVSTHHDVTIGGRTIAYTATAGTIEIKSDKGAPEARIFYIAYTQDGADPVHRPVTFLYNGGPGCASVPLDMGALGPRRVLFPNAGHNVGPPYQLVNNEYSLLDKSDLVFIDAPGTGYSHLLPKVDPKSIYGIDQDAAAFGAFIYQYVTRNDRWNSPKFLLGESYGTPRSAVLVNYLQSNNSMAFNGVILLSSVLDFDTIAPGPGNDIAYVTYLPTEAAVNWYHSNSPNKGSLQSVVGEARAFANGPYASALIQGDRLSRAQFGQIASQLSHLIGLNTGYIEKADLRVLPQRYEKELLIESGQSTGRLDARYVGYDLDPLGDSADYDPADAATDPGFQASFLSYVRNDLGWKSEETYNECTGDIFGLWDFTRKGTFPWIAPTTSNDLQQAMIQNPHLRVFVGAGYFDMATPFGAAEWTFSHLELPQALRDHVSFGYYESGHMVYLHVPSLEKFHGDLDKYFDATLGQ